jgi:integrase
MPLRAQKERLLSANVKVIARTVRQVAEGASKPGEYRIVDERGLVLHVLPSGTATWFFHYDLPHGRSRIRRKLKLGRLDDLALAEAAKRVGELRADVRDGADPVGAKTNLRSGLTFAELAEARLTTGQALRESSARDYRDLLRRDILPALGPLMAVEVTKQNVLDLIDSIATRGATRRADTARAIVSSIYSFGIDRGLIKENPASGLRSRHDDRPRDVVLTPDQLRRLWHALDTGEAAATPAMARIIRLALLTGQRRAEIASTRVSDLDLDSSDPTLVIGGSRAKNHNTHRVPLSPQANAEFQAAIASAGPGVFVFPNPSGTGHILPRSVSKAMERSREKLSLGDVRVHDLRRTVGSMMTRFGVPRDVRERVLNHGGKRSGSITESVYSWYDFASEKRAALELWADALTCIVEGRQEAIDSYSTRLSRLKGSGTVMVG